jgi:hypothetical protein
MNWTYSNAEIGCAMMPKRIFAEGNPMQLTDTHVTPGAIWNRLLRPERNDMSPEAARYFLKLAFDQQDLDRMHELTDKNQAGDLSADERDELNAYRRIGLELDLLQAKASRAVNSPPVAG